MFSKITFQFKLILLKKLKLSTRMNQLWTWLFMSTENDKSSNAYIVLIR